MIVVLNVIDVHFLVHHQLLGPAANTGISVTGAGANVVMDGGACGICNTGFNITNNSTVTISAMSFKLNTFDIIQTGASHLMLSWLYF